MAQSFGQANGFSVTMEGPFGSVKASDKVSSVTLLADNWKGAQSPYTQEAAVAGISVGSIVDLQPDPEQLALLCELGIALVAENDSGTVTVHSIGGKPKSDMTIQVTVREVTQV